MDEMGGTAAGLPGARLAGGRRALAVGCLLLADLLPLVALLPAVRSAFEGAVTPYTLLPLLTLPTVVAAARCRRHAYRGQLAAAIAVCVLAVVLEPVPAAAQSIAVLGTGSALVFATVLVRRSRRSLLAHLAELRRASTTDPLTGTLNRRGLAEQIPALSSAAAAGGGRLGIAAIDLDRFKAVNDTFGHAAGDRVLQAVCERAARIVGSRGVVVRSGGEELLLVTVGDAAPVAETLIASLRSRPLEPAVTISVGAFTTEAARCTGPEELWSAAAVADRALYRAKRLGRDRMERAIPADLIGDGPAGAGGLDDGSPDAPAGSWIPTVEQVPGHVTAAAAPHDAGRAGDLAIPVVQQATGAGVLPEPDDPASGLVRRRQVGRSDRLLYQAIVACMIAIGVAAALEQALTGRVPGSRAFGVLAAGMVVGAIVLIRLGRVRTAGGLVPILVLGSAFQAAVVVAAPMPSRPTALMMLLLPGLLIAAHWPRAPLLAQMAVTAGCCVAASIGAGRPLAAVAGLAAATAVAMLAALAVMGAQRRRREAVETLLHRSAVTDPLTGLGNRRALEAVVAEWPAGHLLLLDVDAFKSVNDRFGHPRGDMLLRSIGRSLRRSAAESGRQNRAYRIGGDEFVVAGPGPEPADLLDLMHAGLHEIGVTVTVGRTSWSVRTADGLPRWIAQADRQLLDGKRSRPCAGAGTAAGGQPRP